MYKYFIVYLFRSNKGSGIANCSIERNNIIENIQDIKSMEKAIIQQNEYEQVVILNFNLLEKR